jgi:hypothetical protein
MADGPQVRATLIKTAIDAINKLPTDEARRILAQIPQSTLREAEVRTRMEWVPLERNIEIVDATLAALGPERFREMRRRTTARVARSPIVSAVLSGALHLFGASPLALFRLMPRVYGLVSRDAGSVHVEEVGPSRLRLVYQGLPPVMTASPGWPDMITVANEAIFDLVHARGTVCAESLDRGRGHLVLSVTLGS